MGHTDEAGAPRATALLREVATDILEHNAELRRHTARLLEWNAKLRAENELIRTALRPRPALTGLVQSDR